MRNYIYTLILLFCYLLSNAQQKAWYSNLNLDSTNSNIFEKKKDHFIVNLDVSVKKSSSYPMIYAMIGNRVLNKPSLSLYLQFENTTTGYSIQLPNKYRDSISYVKYFIDNVEIEKDTITALNTAKKIYKIDGSEVSVRYTGDFQKLLSVISATNCKEIKCNRKLTPSYDNSSQVYSWAKYNNQKKSHKVKLNQLFVDFKGPDYSDVRFFFDSFSCTSPKSEESFDLFLQEIQQLINTAIALK